MGLRESEFRLMVQWSNILESNALSFTKVPILTSLMTLASVCFDCHLKPQGKMESSIGCGGESNPSTLIAIFWTIDDPPGLVTVNNLIVNYPFCCWHLEAQKGILHYCISWYSCLYEWKLYDKFVIFNHLIRQATSLYIYTFLCTVQVTRYP